MTDKYYNRESLTLELIRQLTDWDKAYVSLSKESLSGLGSLDIDMLFRDIDDTFPGFSHQVLLDDVGIQVLATDIRFVKTWSDK